MYLVELSKVLYNCCCETSMVYDLFVGCDKEWYSWHFLKMVKIVSYDCIYAKLIRFVKNKESFITNSLEKTCSRSLVMKTRLVKL
jgi:RNA processing factor Prp31